MNWEEKAEWLRINGYNINISEINGGGMEEKDDYKWFGYIDKDHDDWHVYAMSIPDAVEKVYDAVREIG